MSFHLHVINLASEDSEPFSVDKFSMTEVYKEVTTFVGQFEQRFGSKWPPMSLSNSIWPNTAHYMTPNETKWPLSFKPDK